MSARPEAVIGLTFAAGPRVLDPAAQGPSSGAPRPLLPWGEGGAGLAGFKAKEKGAAEAVPFASWPMRAAARSAHMGGAAEVHASAGEMRGAPKVHASACEMRRAAEVHASPDMRGAA